MTRRELRPGALFKGRRIVTRVQDGTVFFIVVARTNNPFSRPLGGGHISIKMFMKWARGGESCLGAGTQVRLSARTMAMRSTARSAAGAPPRRRESHVVALLSSVLCRYLGRRLLAGALFRGLQ